MQDLVYQQVFLVSYPPSGASLSEVEMQERDRKCRVFEGSHFKMEMFEKTWDPTSKYSKASWGIGGIDGFIEGPLHWVESLLAAGWQVWSGPWLDFGVLSELSAVLECFFFFCSMSNLFFFVFFSLI